MKKYLFLTSLCLTALLATAKNWGGKVDNYKFEMRKNVEQTFNVTPNPILDIEGTYSDIIVTTWDKQQIDFNVKIEVKGNDNKQVEARLNSINIEIIQTGNIIKAKTLFENYPYKKFNGYMSIKYYMKVPKDVFMELDTKYGDIMVDTVYKKFEVDIKYGKLTAGNLMDYSSIDVKYGNININYAKNIDLELAYSDCKINKVDNIEGELRYSNLVATEIGQGTLEHQYCDVKIEKIDHLRTKNQYSDMKITNVARFLYAKIQYSDLKTSCDGLCPEIEIEGQYSDVNLTINEKASFKYDFKTVYGDIKSSVLFNVKNNEAHGTYGNDNQGNIKISLQYGDIRINK